MKLGGKPLKPQSGENVRILLQYKSDRQQIERLLYCPDIPFPFAEQIGIAKQILSGMVYLGRKTNIFKAYLHFP
jgi:hypothetical protein